MVALLAEGVDRNPRCWCREMWPESSPSSRRAWIEITAPRSGSASHGVALLAEGVDRNQSVGDSFRQNGVALLAEGVDRNPFVESDVSAYRVALLAEGVDRNILRPS